MPCPRVLICPLLRRGLPLDPVTLLKAQLVGSRGLHEQLKEAVKAQLASTGLLLEAVLPSDSLLPVELSEQSTLEMLVSKLPICELFQHSFLPALEGIIVPPTVTSLMQGSAEGTAASLREQLASMEEVREQLEAALQAVQGKLEFREQEVEVLQMQLLAQKKVLDLRGALQERMALHLPLPQVSCNALSREAAPPCLIK